MSQQLSSDEIRKLCANLVYQVAYAFYDTPYIIILKLMVHDNVTTELELANKLGLTTPEVRKYMGTFGLHRLLRRHVNKEKVPIPEWRLKQLNAQAQAQASNNKPGGGQNGRERTKDVHYWYLDYREFADVVKYRLAMMRKDIDDKIKQEVGHRGYICPMDGRMYDPLDLSNVFDPFTNSFKCEDCSTELIEHDPTVSQNGVNTTAQDAMQRFNIATAPIRDALKAVESVNIPALNIVAWIAQNVKTSVAQKDGQMGDDADKRFEVVIGQEEDQEEKERLAQKQREQNALPHWYTHSTVTGQATTLGLADRKRREMLEERLRSRKVGEKDIEDESLAAHYEILGEGEVDGTAADGTEEDVPSGREGPAEAQAGLVEVKTEPEIVAGVLGVTEDEGDEEDDEDGMEDVTPIGAEAMEQGIPESGTGKTVMGE
ncbi:hypothetical protein I316_05002 [Kwoniella heveanensis BCC8398]|uniref:HTH TFE/IIEalpha-type domain-containing protein n=1 Tax=Kwoniella heveanensis BCC8398 TaxID=1296120 RepID=A0A1B9GQH7_9TREE|nr:hypothetical protein I316_05002 [Kwoniella heveanensis BCC8398]